MASFRKRGKYWSYRIRVKGLNDEWTEYSESGFTTKPEARDAAVKKEAELKSLSSYSGTLTFLEFGTMWLETYVKDKVKPNTYKSYRHGIKFHAIPAFGHLKLKDIKPIYYQKFIDGIFEKGLTYNTAKNVHNAVLRCLKRAVQNGFIASNPCENVVIKKKPATKLKFIEPDIVPQLLTFIYKRNYTYGLFFETLFESGMRKGECAALKWEDILWDEHCIRIDETLDFQPFEGADIFGSTKTKKSERIIQMRHDYFERLMKYQAHQQQLKELIGEMYQDYGLIFCRDDGSPLPRSTMWNTFKAGLEHIKKHELGLTIHSTRHTHVVMLIEAGWDMKSISERLGHESISTTMDIYAHISKKLAKQSIESFDSYMKKKEKSKVCGQDVDETKIQ